jgi:hypothetical protein
MTCEDWRPCSASELDTRLAAFLEADRQRGFDMAEPPLMRLALFRVGQDTYQFVFSFHHILLDGWSLQLVNNEVVHFYDAFSP